MWQWGRKCSSMEGSSVAMSLRPRAKPWTIEPTTNSPTAQRKRRAIERGEMEKPADEHVTASSAARAQTVRTHRDDYAGNPTSAGPCLKSGTQSNPEPRHTATRAATGYSGQPGAEAASQTPRRPLSATGFHSHRRRVRSSSRGDVGDRYGALNQRGAIATDSTLRSTRYGDPFGEIEVIAQDVARYSAPRPSIPRATAICGPRCSRGQ